MNSSNREATFRKLACRMIQQHGYVEAERIQRDRRDNSSPGTLTFALENAVYKVIREAATVGPLHRSA